MKYSFGKHSRSFRWLGALCAALVAGAGAVATASELEVRSGFAVDELYQVPAGEQGSWVSLAVDKRGRLVASDQYGDLYRITLPAAGEAAEVRVERMSVDLGMAHGLLYVGDDLYCMVNGNNKRKSGLYRARDTDGDGDFESVELLKAIDAQGEHGPHSVVLGPDGKSLYIVAGNHTDLPKMDTSRVPRNWQEDLLLPRMWDARGHAVGRMAPGGWIAKTDFDAKQWELVSVGFRNAYDMAFNAQGELFTYDADMEWDIGAPWYRPTRILHVTSGSEFGWRSGSGKWPDYYPDSLPSVVDVGPGSPTGVAFGTGAKFPEKYQNALFCCDWSYGTIYAVHLEADGASYRGQLESMVTGVPLPVTKLLVHPHDGAMYFITGGRKTQSALYRLRYTGGETKPAVVSDAGGEARALRHRLEALHHASVDGAQAGRAIDAAWPYLGHEDRFIRYAARIAIEHQDVSQWHQRALAEQDPQARITAIVALARCGSAELQPAIVAALGAIEWDALSAAQRLELLRAYGLAFARLGQPAEAVRFSALETVDRRFPADESRLNRELSQLLIYLEAPGIVRRTLDVAERAPSQEEQIHYIFHLRSLTSDWDLATRRRYFQAFVDMQRHRGGMSFEGFLRNARDEAKELLTSDEKQALADVLSDNAPLASVASTTRPVVKKWSAPELLSIAKEEANAARDLERGQAMFGVAQCFACHRFDGEGGILGPDLTTVGRRFTMQDLLESIVEPSKVVSDQYRTTTFVTDDGRVINGRVINLNEDKLQILTDMLDPGSLTTIDRSSIEDEQPSSTSLMPAGLLDTLTAEEILDLLAYLQSGDETTAAR